MIIGSLTIEGNSVVTHRDTYLIQELSVISVRRPFLAAGMVLALGVGGFGLSCMDLLYPEELSMVAVIFVVSLIGGWNIGQLQLLSRDLRGSELMGVIYGSYGHINGKRKEIAAAKEIVTYKDQATTEVPRV